MTSWKGLSPIKINVSGPSLAAQNAKRLDQNVLEKQVFTATEAVQLF
jgi:hypothetical protein